jgi:hypothetical protein
MSNGDTGFSYTGITILSLVVIGIISLRFSLRGAPKRLIAWFIPLLVILMFAIPPSFSYTAGLIRSVQEGLKAVSYDKLDSTVSYQINNLYSNYVQCNCSMVFLNYSTDNLEIRIDMKELEQQMAENLRIHGNINVETPAMEDKAYLLNPKDGYFSNPKKTILSISFRLPCNGGDNNSGGMFRPNVTIYSTGEKRSFK